MFGTCIFLLHFLFLFFSLLLRLLFGVWTEALWQYPRSIDASWFCVLQDFNSTLGMLLYATSSSRFASKISTAHHPVLAVVFYCCFCCYCWWCFVWLECCVFSLFLFFSTKAIIIIHVFNPHKEREWSNSEYDGVLHTVNGTRQHPEQAGKARQGKAIIIKRSAVYSLTHPFLLLTFFF